MSGLNYDFNFAAPADFDPNDYTSDASVKTLNDPRFLNDLRTFYEARGVRGSEDELISRWKSDNRWRETNIGSTAVNAARSAVQSQIQNEREARLSRTWNAMPNFWEEGGAGVVDALKDYIPAVVFDPTNLIPGAAAAKPAVIASTAAAAAGRSALRAGIGAGARTAAPIEGALNAVVGGAQSLLEQSREVNLGLEDSVSLSRAGIEAGASGILGAGIGGVIGGVVGGVASGGARGRADQLAGRFTPEEIGRLTAGDLDAAVADTSRLGPQAQTAADNLVAEQAAAAELQAKLARPPTPEEVQAQLAQVGARDSYLQQSRLNSYEQQILAEYADARARAQSEPDPVQADLLNAAANDWRDIAARIGDLRTAPERVRTLEAQIEAGIQKGKLTSDQVFAMRGQVATLRADFNTLLGSTDSDAAIAYLRRVNDLEEELKASPATATPATPAPVTPTPTPAPAAATTTPAAAATPTTPAKPGRKKSNPAEVTKGEGGATAAASEASAEPASPPEPVATPAPPPPAPRVTHTRPVLVNAVREGIDPDTLPAGATVADVTELANARRKAKAGPDASLSDDMTTLERALAEIDDMIPTEVKQDLRLFKNKAFLERVLKADERTAPRYERFQDLWNSQSADDDPQLEMRINNKTLDKAAVRVMRGEIAAMRRADPDRPLAEIQAEVTERMANRAAQGPEDRVRGALPQSGQLINNGAVFTTAGRGNNGRFQRFLMSGPIQPEDGRLEKARFGDVRRILMQPSTRLFDYEAALTRARNSMEAAGRQNDTIAKGHEQGARAKVEAWAKQRAEAGLPSDTNSADAQAVYRDALAEAVRTRPADRAGFDIMGFTASGSERLNGGKRYAKKGDTVYLDATTGKVFPDLVSLYKRRPGMENAELAAQRTVPFLDDRTSARPLLSQADADILAANRSMTRAQRKAAAQGGPAPVIDDVPTQSTRPYAAIYEAIDRFIQDGDLPAFKALLAKFSPPEPTAQTPGRANDAARRAPNQTPASPTKNSVPASSVPGTKNGETLVLVPKNGGKILVMGQKMANEGRNATALLKSSESIADYDAIYVPPKLSYADKIARGEGFRNPAPSSAPTAQTAAAPETPAPLTMPAAQFDKLSIELASDAEREVVSRVLSSIFKLTPEVARGRMEALNGADLRSMLTEIELLGTNSKRKDEIKGWPKTRDEYVARTEAITTLSAIEQRYAPIGISLDGLERSVAIEQIASNYSQYSADTLKRLGRIFDRMMSGSQGPNIAAGLDGEGASFNVRQNSIALPRNAQKANVLLPVEIKAIHELAHWSYFNVLTPTDRVAFWNTLGKFYNPETGQLDRTLLRSYVPDTTGIPNAMSSPHELFANAFTAYAQGRLLPEAGEVGFWQRVGGYVQAMFDFFTGRKPIPDELIPLFSKILPDNQANRIAADDSTFLKSRDYDALSREAAEPTGKLQEMRSRIEAELMTELDPPDPAAKERSLAYNWNTMFAPKDGLRGRWEHAIASRNADALITVAEDTASYLGTVFRTGDPNRKENRALWIFRGKGNSAGEYSRWPLGRDRIKDMLTIVHQNLGARADNAERVRAPENMRVEDKQRIFDQLEQIYHFGHFTSKDRLDSGTALYTTKRSPSPEDMVRLSGATNDEILAAGKKKWAATSVKWLFKYMESDIVARSNSLLGRAPVQGMEFNPPQRAASFAEAKAMSQINAVLDVSKAPVRTIERDTPPAEVAAVTEEVMARNAQAPAPPRPLDVSQQDASDLAKMSNDALVRSYDEAMAADSPQKESLAFEMQRRANQPGHRSTPQTPTVEISARIEAEQYAGQIENGIPPAARPAIQDILSRVTHRDPAIEATTRRVLYRALNLMGVTHNAPDAPPITRGTLAQLLDEELPVGLADDPFDIASVEFQNLRANLRSIGKQLTADKGDSYQVVETMAELAWRTMPDSPMKREAADAAGDRMYSIVADMLAEKTHPLQVYMNTTIPAPILTDMAERVRYLTDSVIARKDVLQAAPQLAHGRMVEPTTSWSGRFTDSVPTALAPDFVTDVMSRPYHAENVRNWMGSAREGQRDDQPIVFYTQNTSGQRRISENVPSAASSEMNRAISRLSPQSMTEVSSIIIKRGDLVDSVRRSLQDDASGATIGPILDDVKTLDDILEKQFNLPPQPSSMPMLMRAHSVMRFDDTGVWSGDHPAIAALLNKMVENRAMSEGQASYIAGLIPPDTSGTKTLAALRQNIGKDPDAKIKKALTDLGYQAAVFETKVGGLVVPQYHVYDDSAVIALNDPSLLRAPLPTHVNMRGVMGEVLAAAMDSDTSPATLGPIADSLAISINGGPLVDSVLAKLGRSKEQSDAKLVELKRSGLFDRTLASNAQRARSVGFNTMASFFESHFPQFNERVGSRLSHPERGVLTAIQALDGEGNFKRWARKAKPFFTPNDTSVPQPTSHARLVLALRNPSGSMFEKNLTPDERKAYNQIRQALRDEFQSMRAEGIPIGDKGPDYFPQVWSADAIRANRNQFEQGMLTYLKAESDRAGRPFDMERAQATATDMRLAMSEDVAGDAVSDTMGMGRNPMADHIDFARLIDLDLDPNARKALEPFLETDLEAMVVKYFDASTRRRMFHEQFGANARGFYDYMAIAAGGQSVIAKLLQTNMQFRKSTMRMGGAGFVETRTLNYDKSRAPFQDNPDGAAQFVEDLVEAHKSGGAPAAREMLTSLTRGGEGPDAFHHRAEAIVNALNDFGGEKARVHRDEFDFIETMFQSSMRRPLGSTQASIDTSRYLRTFNSVTLLGFTMLNSLGDTVLPIIRSGEVRASTRAWTKYASDPDYRRMFASVGTTIENVVQEHMMHLNGSAGTRWGQAFFYANGLTPWTNTMRQISGAVGYESFVTMQTKAARYYNASVPLQQQHPEFKKVYRYLKNYGLEAYASNNISLSNRQLIADDRNLRVAINRFADDAVFSPNPNDIPIWAQTPMGAIVFQLKAFPLMMQRMAKSVFVDDLGVMAQAWREDGINGALHNLPKRAALMLTVAPALGAGTLALNDQVRGRGGEENREHAVRTRTLQQFLGEKAQPGEQSDFMGWYLESLMLAGGFGLLADLFHKTAQNADNGAAGQQRIASAVFGPSFGTFMSGMNVATGATNAAVNFEPDSNAMQRGGFRELLQRVPILGGVTSLREGIVDQVVGPPTNPR